jgi:ankyrin repeat protein
MGVLHDAINEYNDDQISWLIEHGADVNALDENGDTPLMVAARRGSLDAEQTCALLERGADIHAKDRSGKTPLMLALDHSTLTGFLDDAGALLGQYALLQPEALVDRSSENGRLALLLAIYQDDPASIHALLDAGADVNARNAAGRTPLMFAVELGRAAALRTLLERGADVHAVVLGQEVTRWTALHFAAYENQPECAAALLEYGAQVDVRDAGGRTPLMWAALWAGAPLVRLLLEHGADVLAEDEHGNYALHQAAWLGNAETIRTLLAWGAGKNEEHLQGAFGTCFAENNHDSAPMFLAAGAKVGLYEAIMMRDRAAIHRLVTVDKVDMNDTAPLFGAIEKGDLETVQLLLEYGIDPNAGDGDTAVIYACGMGQTEIAEALMEAGADVNFRGRYGETAFTTQADCYISEQRRIHLMRKLITYGADINAQREDGETALMKAVWRGERSVVRFLLEQGANVNLRGYEDCTALIYAAEGGHTRIARLLVAYGADVTLHDEKGRTALSLAKRWPGKRIARLLKAAGATE